LSCDIAIRNVSTNYKGSSVQMDCVFCFNWSKTF